MIVLAYLINDNVYDPKQSFQSFSLPEVGQPESRAGLFTFLGHTHWTCHNTIVQVVSSIVIMIKMKVIIFSSLDL